MIERQSNLIKFDDFLYKFLQLKSIIFQMIGLIWKHFDI